MTFLVRWKGLEPPTYWFVAIEKSLDYTILSQIKHNSLHYLHPMFPCFTENMWSLCGRKFEN